MSKFSFANLSKSLRLLSNDEINDIYNGALEVLNKKGVKYLNSEALRIINENGGEVNQKDITAKLPEELVKESVMKAPSKISLYDRNGKLVIALEGNNLIFNPGSAAINIIDIKSGEIRKPNTKDLIQFVRLKVPLL